MCNCKLYKSNDECTTLTLRRVNICKYATQMTSATLTSSWAEAPQKIARMTLTIKLDRNWSSFQLAINTPPLSVTGSVIAPSARMLHLQIWNYERKLQLTTLTLNYHDILCKVEWKGKGWVVEVCTVGHYRTLLWRKFLLLQVVPGFACSVASLCQYPSLSTVRTLPPTP